MKKPKKVYVVFKPGNNDLEIVLNVYEDFDNAKEMWEHRTGKPYEKYKDRENGCFLLPIYIEP